MTLLQEKILFILTPLLGKTMTQAALQTNCKKLGITPEQIQHKHLAELSQQLGKGLRVFLGAENAELVITLIAELN